MLLFNHELIVISEDISPVRQSYIVIKTFGLESLFWSHSPTLRKGKKISESKTPNIGLGSHYLRHRSLEVGSSILSHR